MTKRRLVILMLCVFIAINAADKVAFGIAAVPIMRDLQLSSTQFGVLGSSFYLLFSLAAIVAGRLGDRLPASWLLGGMALIWTAAQLPLLAPVGLGVFFACRVLLGAGEGPALGTALQTAYGWYADARRPAVTAVIETGVPLGAAAGTIAVTHIMAGAGWHAAFGALGVASLIWCVAWFFVERTGERAPGPAPEPALPLRALLLNRTIAGVMVAGFAAYWISALSVVWLPAFLELGSGLARPVVGNVIGSAWFVQVALFAATGTLSSGLTRRGYSSNISRAALASGALVIGGVAMIGLTWSTSLWLSVAFAVLFIGSTVAAVTVLPPIVAEIAPALQRGTALGACIGIASLGAVLGPLAVGRAIDAWGHDAAAYREAFAASGVLVILIALIGQLLMRPREDGERLRVVAESALPPARYASGVAGVSPASISRSKK